MREMCSLLTNFRDILGAPLHELPALDASSSPQPAKRQRKRRVTLSGEIKKAEEAGLSVAAGEVYPDHVRLEFGEPVKAVEESGVNPWDQVYAN